MGGTNNALHKKNTSASNRGESQPLAPLNTPLIAPRLMCALREKSLPFLQHIVHFPHHSNKSLLPLNIKKHKYNAHNTHMKKNHVTDETILSFLKAIKNKKLRSKFLFPLQRTRKTVF